MISGHYVFAAAELGLASSASAGGVDYLRVILALGFCLALGVAAAFVLRSRHRLRTQRTVNGLHVVQSLRVDTRTCVHVLRYGEQEILLASGPTGIAITPCPGRDTAAATSASTDESA